MMLIIIFLVAVQIALTALILAVMIGTTAEAYGRDRIVKKEQSNRDTDEGEEDRL